MGTEAVLTCTHNLSFEQKRRKNITIFHLKIIVLIAVKNCNILHRRVFVMQNIFGLNGMEYLLCCSG